MPGLVTMVLRGQVCTRAPPCWVTHSILASEASTTETSVRSFSKTRTQPPF